MRRALPEDARREQERLEPKMAAKATRRAVRLARRTFSAACSSPRRQDCGQSVQVVPKRGQACTTAARRAEVISPVWPDGAGATSTATCICAQVVQEEGAMGKRHGASGWTSGGDADD